MNKPAEPKFIPRCGPDVKFETPEEMQAGVDRYFTDILRNKTADALGEPPPPDRVTDNRHPTMIGLSLALNMAPTTLRHYGKKPEFAATVELAKMRVGALIEERLYSGGNSAGAQFALKNHFGWRDEKHLSVDTREEKTIRILAPPESELARRLADARGELIEGTAEEADGDE